MDGKHGGSRVAGGIKNAKVTISLDIALAVYESDQCDGKQKVREVSAIR